jgi:hypothetical protein
MFALVVLQEMTFRCIDESIFRVEYAPHGLLAAGLRPWRWGTRAKTRLGHEDCTPVAILYFMQIHWSIRIEGVCRNRGGREGGKMQGERKRCHKMTLSKPQREPASKPQTGTERRTGGHDD